MITIFYEAHGTTLDNEADLASGWFDVELSKLGKRQAKEMGERYKDEKFDAIFTSDLKRAYRKAQIAFAGRGIRIIKDKRLRECNYGDLTRHPNNEVEPQKIRHIKQPFPNGESYEQVVERIKVLLDSRLRGNDCTKYGKVLIIGHRAAWYALENLINGRSLEDLITSPWQWQPGWRYELKRENLD